MSSAGDPLSPDSLAVPPGRSAPSWWLLLCNVLLVELCCGVAVLASARVDPDAFGALRRALAVALRSEALPAQAPAPELARQPATEHEATAQPAQAEPARDPQLSAGHEALVPAAPEPASEPETTQHVQLAVATEHDSPAVHESPPDPRDTQLLEAATRALAARKLAGFAHTRARKRGIAIEASAEPLYEPGSDRLRPEGRAVLEEIVELSVLFPHRVAVDVYTGEKPPAGARFASPWELAAGRAVAAVRYLVDVGALDPGRARASGYVQRDDASAPPDLLGDDVLGEPPSRERIVFSLYRDDEESDGD